MKCLNCGHECQGKYCPECGQPTSTTRTTWRSFSVASVADMLRFRGPFLHTCWMLLCRPWTVISDYTAGRRIRYTSPLLLLLTLGIYSSLLNTWLLGIPSDADEGIMFLKLYQFSFGMGMFIMLPPVILAVKAVYRKSNIGRYNAPEILIAGIFLSSYSLLLDIIFIPIEMVWDEDGNITTFVVFLVSSICLFKAAKIRSWLKAGLRYVLFWVVLLIFWTAYATIVELLLRFLFRG